MTSQLAVNHIFSNYLLMLDKRIRLATSMMVIDYLYYNNCYFGCKLKGQETENSVCDNKELDKGGCKG